MKLTVKDKDFLERLRSLLESKDLSIELKDEGFKRFVLRQNYGNKISSAFHMTRQGVRWRFQRLFSHVYVEAFETILMIEKTFGTQLRNYAVRISRERYELRKEILKEGFRDASIR